MRGSKYRVPRKFKKARMALYRGRSTEKQRKILCRAIVMRSMGGWARVRKTNMHVAMGDTSSIRRRIRDGRRYDECGKPAWRRCGN